eukprot:scaffold181273_cov17-Prasinocladus_malaysianus.AAC.1
MDEVLLPSVMVTVYSQVTKPNCLIEYDIGSRNQENDARERKAGRDSNWPTLGSCPHNWPIAVPKLRSKTALGTPPLPQLNAQTTTNSVRDSIENRVCFANVFAV